MGVREALWRGSAVLAAICLTAATPGATPEPPAPDQWQLDLAPGQCALRRSISTPQPVLVALDTVPGSDAYRLTLRGGDLPRLPETAPLPRTTLVFRPAESRIDWPALAARTDSGQVIQLRGLNPDVLAAFRAATSLTLVTHAGDAGPFPMPGADKAIAALAKCESDQLVLWGADPAQFQPGGTRPVATLRRDDWVDDAALRSIDFDGSELLARLQVAIAADGRIDGCRRIDEGATGNAEAVACRAVSGRKLFTPAHGPEGTPVRGVATFDVRLSKRAGIR